MGHVVPHEFTLHSAFTGKEVPFEREHIGPSYKNTCIYSYLFLFSSVSMFFSIQANTLASEL